MYLEVVEYSNVTGYFALPSCK